MATTTNNGISTIYKIVAADGSTAEVHSQGAHLTSWKGPTGEEQLYTSPTAVYKEGGAIRGGVPIIFPAFGGNKWQTHGVARNRQFHVDTIEEGKIIFAQQYRNDDAKFPSLNCDLVVTIDINTPNKLLLSARVINFKEITAANDADDLKAFQFAFHTYFRFSDVANVELHGFDDIPYFDSLQGDKEILSPGNTRHITCEIDRQYRNVAQGRSFNILDRGFAPGRARSITVKGSDSMPDVVLWNPWIEKNARLADLEKPDGYKRFVCIEHAAIDKPIPLNKCGVVWTGSQEITTSIVDVSKI